MDNRHGGRSGISRRAVLGMLGMTCAAAGMGCSFGGRKKSDRKLLVLGFDGMDYRIVGEMMARGELPNFSKVARKGAFLPLVSSNPPQSPVAWSNFITGTNPGGHGIFDFVTRDPKTYEPYLSLSKASQSNTYLKLFSRHMLTNKGDAVLLRKGKSWWNILQENGVPSTVICVPSNFPPEDSDQRTLSGMGTPDLKGTFGTFTFYTSAEIGEDTVRAGKIRPVKVVDNVVETTIRGPRNNRVEGSPETEVPLKVYLDPADNKARITFQGQDFTLRQGEWSGWYEVDFNFTALAEVSGIVRFYLKSIGPEFWLYRSPINIDPDEPAQTISTPPQYSATMTEALGLHYTQGIPEDLIAFNEGWLNEDEFLVQMRLAMNERTALYRYELDRFCQASEGVYFCYFGSTDSCSHMFWRHRDPKHPHYDPKISPRYAGTIEEFYRVMDERVGYALDRISKKTTVFIMSDHGFAPFYRAVHLNRWLLENGYMAFLDPARDESGEFFDNIDWSRTTAYALGLNGLYINLQGREGKGIVPPEEKDTLVRELTEKLKQAKDPDRGGQMINEAYDSSAIYSGQYVGLAPDIVVGYNYGYRASWETVLGKVSKGVVRDSVMRWSGDHCIDPSFVPGIFFSSRKTDRESVRIEDIAPSILALFGVGAPGMDGKSIFK